MNDQQTWKIIVTLENGKSAQAMEIFSTHEEASKTIQSISELGFLLLLPDTTEPVKIEPEEIHEFRIENK